MNIVSRQEKKYLLREETASKLSNKLGKVISADSHNGPNGYIVRSLYFDSLRERDFVEKEEGVEIRRKIRLRIYNPEDKVALLEMKQKQGNQQLKRSLKMTKQDALELIKGNYTVLLKYSEKVAQEFFTIMNMYVYRPKSIVQYNRKAFIAKENNIRVTFDSNIIATETSFDLFSEKLVMNPVFEKDKVVLEVKYNRFLLSYIKDLLNSVEKSELSVSKYCLSRTNTLNYKFI